MAGSTTAPALTDAQWAALEPLIQAFRSHHKAEHHDLRRTVEAIDWRWRKRRASKSAWCSRTAPTSGRTTRRLGQPEQGDGAQRDPREALGRSRGELGAKGVAAADARGRAFVLALAPGQAHEAPMAPPLLDGLPDAPLWVAGDRGLSSAAVREQVWDMGAGPAIPPRCNEEQVACPPWVYNSRNRVERLWARLKG